MTTENELRMAVIVADLMGFDPPPVDPSSAPAEALMSDQKLHTYEED